MYYNTLDLYKNYRYCSKKRLLRWKHPIQSNTLNKENVLNLEHIPLISTYKNSVNNLVYSIKKTKNISVQISNFYSNLSIK